VVLFDLDAKFDELRLFQVLTARLSAALRQRCARAAGARRARPPRRPAPPERAVRRGAALRTPKLLRSRGAPCSASTWCGAVYGPLWRVGGAATRLAVCLDARRLLRLRELGGAAAGAQVPCDSSFDFLAALRVAKPLLTELQVRALCSPSCRSAPGRPSAPRPAAHARPMLPTHHTCAPCMPASASPTLHALTLAAGRPRGRRARACGCC